MANSADPDQLAFSALTKVDVFSSQLICISSVCKDKAYPGSAGQLLMFLKFKPTLTGVFGLPPLVPPARVPPALDILLMGQVN